MSFEPVLKAKSRDEIGGRVTRSHITAMEALVHGNGQRDVKTKTKMKKKGANRTERGDALGKVGWNARSPIYKEAAPS